MDEKDCVFCKIVKGDIPTEKIYENDGFFSFPDANPITKGHSLVISKAHIEKFTGLEGSEGNALIDAINKTASKVVEENDAKGFNILNNNGKAAGQVVKHLHFHVVPRKEGDGIKPFG